MQITNKRIVDFCQKYPSFDLESIVLAFIDIVEKTSENIVPSLDSNLASKILNSLQSIHHSVCDIDTKFNNKHLIVIL